MTSKELKDQMEKEYGFIREDLKARSKSIQEAYRSENRQVLQAVASDAGQQLADLLLGEYNRILQENGQPLIVFAELEKLAWAAICTSFLEAVSNLLQLEPKNKEQRNWIKCEVHSCAANASQAIHFTFGEMVAPRYIGNSVSRQAVLQAARQILSESPIKF